MKQGWLTILVLAAVVVGLGSFLHFSPPENPNPEYALSAMKPATAGRVRFQRGGGPEIVLEKRAGAWHLTSPFAARADELQVARLLAVLEARTTTRFPASDLARFELAPPQARLVVDDEVLSFGAVNTVTREQYVLARDMVYGVDVKHVTGLPAGVSALVRKRLFDADDRLTQFELPAFRVAQQDGKWVVTPAPAEPSQDDVLRWVEQWRQAAALRAVPHDGKRKPTSTIRITRADGRTVALGIIQREPELLLLHPEDGMQYTFFAEIGNRMLAPPGTRPKLPDPLQPPGKHK